MNFKKINLGCTRTSMFANDSSGDAGRKLLTEEPHTEGNI